MHSATLLRRLLDRRLANSSDAVANDSLGCLRARKGARFKLGAKRVTACGWGGHPVRRRSQRRTGMSAPQSSRPTLNHARKGTLANVTPRQCYGVCARRGASRRAFPRGPWERVCVLQCRKLRTTPIVRFGSRSGASGGRPALRRPSNLRFRLRSYVHSPLPGRNSGHAEPQAVVPVVRRVPVAERGSAEPADAVPAAAPVHAKGGLPRAARIGWR